MNAPSDVVEHLRSRERAAYEVWRRTPIGAVELHTRADAWHAALRALNQEMEARAVLLSGRPDDRTEVR